MYRVEYKFCPDLKRFYDGKTRIPCHSGFSEHLRAGNNPASYLNNAVGKHNSENLQNCQSKLMFTVLDKEMGSAPRTISEGMLIIILSKDEPTY